MLYQINKTTPADSDRVRIESPEALGINEKHIEDFLASHLVELIPEDQLMLLAQERQFQEEADILALDKVGTLFIFELKRWKSNAENLLQVMRYGQIFGRYDYQRLEQLAHRHQRLEGSLRAKHQEYFSLPAPLPEEAFNADQRFVVVTNGVDRDTLQAIKYWDRKGVKIDSLTYKLYRIGDQPYIQFETYNPELDLQLEENPGVYIVNTNFSYMENAWKEMLGDGRTGKAAAYYDRKNAVRRISKGSTVFLYQTGSGVVAKGRATTDFQMTDQDGVEEEQYFVPLQFDWALSASATWSKLAPKAHEINAATNASNRFRQTVFNVSKDTAEAIQKIYERKQFASSQAQVR